jgi:NADPH:quinone reductase-like Zn-dependent oxidoreductase
LAAKGALVLCNGDPGGSFFGPMIAITAALAASAFGSQKTVMWIAKVSNKDLADLKELIEAGKVAPVIDKRYALADAAEALRYQGEGHGQGKSVITV